MDVFDPKADKNEVLIEYSLDLKSDIKELNFKKYSGIILAVAHKEFENIDFLSFKKNGTVIFDIKGVLNKELVDDRL